MCNILEGKNLVIAGDSLSDQFYVTLIHMIWTRYLPTGNSYLLDTNTKRRLSADVEKPWINSIAANSFTTK